MKYASHVFPFLCLCDGVFSRICIFVGIWQGHATECFYHCFELVSIGLLTVPLSTCATPAPILCSVVGNFSPIMCKEGPIVLRMPTQGKGHASSREYIRGLTTGVKHWGRKRYRYRCCTSGNIGQLQSHNQVLQGLEWAIQAPGTVGQRINISHASPDLCWETVTVRRTSHGRWEQLSWKWF